MIVIFHCVCVVFSSVWETKCGGRRSQSIPYNNNRLLWFYHIAQRFYSAVSMLAVLAQHCAGVERWFSDSPPGPLAIIVISLQNVHLSASGGQRRYWSTTPLTTQATSTEYCWTTLGDLIDRRLASAPRGTTPSGECWRNYTRDKQCTR